MDGAQRVGGVMRTDADLDFVRLDARVHEWTRAVLDGPDHLGLRRTAPPAHEMALITSGCGAVGRRGCDAGAEFAGAEERRALTAALNGALALAAGTARGGVEHPLGTGWSSAMRIGKGDATRSEDGALREQLFVLVAPLSSVARAQMCVVSVEYIYFLAAVAAVAVAAAAAEVAVPASAPTGSFVWRSGRPPAARG